MRPEIMVVKCFLQCLVVSGPDNQPLFALLILGFLLFFPVCMSQLITHLQRERETERKHRETERDTQRETQREREKHRNRET